MLQRQYTHRITHLTLNMALCVMWLMLTTITFAKEIPQSKQLQIQTTNCAVINARPQYTDPEIKAIAEKQISASIGASARPKKCIVLYAESVCKVKIQDVKQPIDCNPKATKECPTVVTWQQPNSKTVTWKDAEGTCQKPKTKEYQQKNTNKEKTESDADETLFNKKYNKRTKSDEIKKLQEELKKRGFNPGKIDGKWGKKTEAALKKFKQSQQGAVNAKEQKSFNKVEAIKTLQRKLQKAGFNPGKIDGKMGPKTRNALKKFQKSKGIPPTGTITPQTAMAINKLEDIPKSERNIPRYKRRGTFTVPPKQMSQMIKKAVEKQPLINGKKITPQQLAAFLRQENTLMRQYGKNSEGNRDGYGQVNKITRRQFQKAYNKIYGKPKGNYIHDAQRQINTTATVLNIYANSKRYGCNGNITCAIVAYNAGPNGRTFRNYKRGRPVNRITRGYIQSVPRYIRSFTQGTVPSYGRRGRTYLPPNSYARYYWSTLSRELKEE